MNWFTNPNPGSENYDVSVFKRYCIDIFQKRNFCLIRLSISFMETHPTGCVFFCPLKYVYSKDEIILKNLFALMLLFLFHHIINPDELKGKGNKHEQNKAWIIRQTKKEITILKAFEGWFQSTNSQQELNACKQTKKTSN